MDIKLRVLNPRVKPIKSDTLLLADKRHLIDIQNKEIKVSVNSRLKVVEILRSLQWESVRW